jgi:hypothetical protein
LSVPHRRKAQHRRLTAFVVLAISVGCSPGSSAQPASATPAATASAAPTAPITHATGSADLVLRVTDGGGLLPTDLRLAEMPAISIYGDGRVIRLVEAAWEATDPLVPTLVESRLAPEGMTRVLAAAGDVGLLGADRRLGIEGLYDLWMVTFRLAANGASHTTWAYALGFSDEMKYAPPGDVPARKALGELYARLRDLRGWLGEGRVGPETAHMPERLRVYVSPIIQWPEETGATPGPATARPGQDVREWPLDAPPEVFGTFFTDHDGTWRCGLLDSAGAERLGIGTATLDTRWPGAGVRADRAAAVELRGAELRLDPGPGASPCAAATGAVQSDQWRSDPCGPSSTAVALARTGGYGHD